MARSRLSGRLDAGLEKSSFASRLSLTSRILAVNLLPLALLGGGIFYLDGYRKQLLNERYKLARIEAQITAEALAGATRQRQEALLVQIGKEQRMRVRMFDAEGELWADSFALEEPSFTFSDTTKDGWGDDWAQTLDKIVDAVVSAEPVEDYIEPESNEADAWPELARARETGLSQIQLRDWTDGTPVITAAAPVGTNGATLLTTRNAVDITESVRSARSTLGIAVLLTLVASVLLSLYLARTIVIPLRSLSSAAQRVRLGRERQVEVPRLPERKDEIGLLARAVSDMTNALRDRIDGVEHFAADVAHEIKNPLASLRSAVESLSLVDDPDLRNQLLDIASHDVRRIDRLVTEISDASRVDAEISRATLEQVDLGALTEAIIERRDNRDENEGHEITLRQPMGHAMVQVVPTRLERVIENLLDNAVSFSPDGGTIDVTITMDETCVALVVEDQGPGIPEDAREKIFQRFHSIRPDAEDFGNHSGLGLAIARSIAEAHDGALVAMARDNGHQGAKMVLRLPNAGWQAA
uniref:sensor histidine kinase n=1 Tax=Parerythrobacter lutipelagi TaxID=1964208 RepID=UPI0010F67F34|nr:ATP-binding protein [Parerythrobacter lutipelagi]